MVTEQENQLDWSIDLIDSLWFHIGHYLNVYDIHRLSRTCSRLHRLFTSHDFWSYLILRHFGPGIWHRLIKNSLLSIDNNSLLESHNKQTYSKYIYTELMKHKRISFSDLDLFTFDTNRTYLTTADSSSLTGRVLHIKDSIELSYSLRIQTQFKNILPGKYEVTWRMKLNIPYMLGETEFIALPEQEHPSQIAYMRWTQEDFLSMYRCFNCDITRTNLWFYQTIGTIEISGNKPCHVNVSMINNDSIHGKHGVFLDYVELKLCIE